MCEQVAIGDAQRIRHVGEELGQRAVERDARALHALHHEHRGVYRRHRAGAITRAGIRRLRNAVVDCRESDGTLVTQRALLADSDRHADQLFLLQHIEPAIQLPRRRPRAECWRPRQDQ